MINKELNAKVFFLFVESMISGVFISEIINSIRNFLFPLSFWFFLLTLVFSITDFVIWFNTGEEIIIELLEFFGLEFD